MNMENLVLTIFKLALYGSCYVWSFLLQFDLQIASFGTSLYLSRKKYQA